VELAQISSPNNYRWFCTDNAQLSRGHRWLVLSASGFTSQHLVVSQKTEPSFSGTKCGVLGQSQLKMWPVDMARWDWGNSAVQQYIAFRKVRSKTDILLR